VRLRDWNTKPQIKRDQFTFSVANGAKKLIPVNEKGEFAATKEGK
jgi:hypothetical protein